MNTGGGGGISPVPERGRHAASYFLEAAVADIEFNQGWFSILGTDRGLHILELAERLHHARHLPHRR